jgi:hypothetical protein
MLCFACLSAAEDSSALPRNVLTNEGVLLLARAGVSDVLLADLIRHKNTNFDTSAEALAHLARHGLSESVIRAVVEKQDQVRMQPERWSITPMPSAGAGSVVAEQGDAILFTPGAGRGSRATPDRWYRIARQ